MAASGVVRPARIAITSGEPAGVGPDLCLALSLREWSCQPICLADRELLRERAAQLGLAVELLDYDPACHQPHRPGQLAVLHCPLTVPAHAGHTDTRNGAAVIGMLDRAAAGCLSGEFDAMATAPVQKSTLIEAGFSSFTGHTEHLAERTGAPLPVMMLAAGDMRVALATTHLPLKDISAALTAPLLSQVLTILHADLKHKFGLAAPRIAVCGLNPHAGENGHLGQEELTVIAPVIAQLQAQGLNLTGPLPADTVFVPRIMAQYDAVLAMYHDQGLPVIKYAHFDAAVNVTLGLPIIRTSVDHGTALALAGTGRADASSLAAAVNMAVQMVAAAH